MKQIKHRLKLMLPADWFGWAFVVLLIVVLAIGFGLPIAQLAGWMEALPCAHHYACR